MIRDSLKEDSYFDQWITFYEGDIQHKLDFRLKKFKNESYRPQYVYVIAQHYQSLMLQRYSRGDSIKNLTLIFPLLLDVWEESEHLGKDVWTDQQQYTRHAWKVNLDHYINCFWLVGLALALDTPDDQWQRLVALIGNEGEDALLDRVIASRQPSRRIGAELCYPKPYARLLDAVLAPRDKQPELLKAFVDHWYEELDRPATKTMSAMYTRPYWYKYHELEGGYFGYWCIEAVAAVKAFGMDDSLCLGHSNYPGDLLRPDGPTTHAVPGASPIAQNEPLLRNSSKRGFWARFLGR